VERSLFIDLHKKRQTAPKPCLKNKIAQSPVQSLQGSETLKYQKKDTFWAMAEQKKTVSEIIAEMREELRDDTGEDAELFAPYLPKKKAAPAKKRAVKKASVAKAGHPKKAKAGKSRAKKAVKKPRGKAQKGKKKAKKKRR
jgi:hypothetical protein